MIRQRGLDQDRYRAVNPSSLRSNPMNLGIRLPGPFRVGVNTRTGHLTGGVTVGPFSFSGQLGAQPARQAVPGTIPWTLDQAAAAAAADGFVVTGRDANGLTVQRGWRGVYIRTVPGGVTLNRAMPAQVLGAIVFSIVGLAGAIGLVLAIIYT